jgi:hypothetical protein
MAASIHGVCGRSGSQSRPDLLPNGLGGRHENAGAVERQIQPLEIVPDGREAVPSENVDHSIVMCERLGSQRCDTVPLRLSHCTLDQVRADLMMLVRVGHRHRDVGQPAARGHDDRLTDDHAGIAIARDDREPLLGA